MKILMLNKYYFEKSGTERYMFELSRLLESHGHTVVPFSMQSPRNIPTPWSDHFVPELDYHSRHSPIGRFRAALRTIDYPEAGRRTERLIRDIKPDIVHVHNIYHQLSYAPIRAAHRAGIPVVLTAHDYKLVCPNYTFLTQGAICERCRGGRYYEAARHRCAKGRMGDSIVLAAEMYANRRCRDIVPLIDRIIAPSRFMRDKLIEHGIPTSKVMHLFNLLDISRFSPRPGGKGGALFLGRLSPEKGLHTLIDAFGRLPEIPLRIAGDGPLRDDLQRLVAERRLHNIEFLGHCNAATVRELLEKCGFLVAPSEWYENLPYAIVEALACGKPVVASRIGGIPELVADGENGYLFTMGDADDLAARVHRLTADPEQMRRFGEAGRIFAETHFDPEAYYREILSVYNHLLNAAARDSEGKE